MLQVKRCAQSIAGTGERVVAGRQKNRTSALADVLFLDPGGYLLSSLGSQSSFCVAAKAPS
ncbi:MAG: hypothetical protein VB062_10850 [Christensenella sp.]|nr:hypothetical protein [Christensenella sp.]